MVLRKREQTNGAAALLYTTGHRLYTSPHRALPFEHGNVRVNGKLAAGSSLTADQIIRAVFRLRPGLSDRVVTDGVSCMQTDVNKLD